jgi:hypothetical protein
VYSQLTFPLSATRARAVLWWQGPTKQGLKEEEEEEEETCFSLQLPTVLKMNSWRRNNFILQYRSICYRPRDTRSIAPMNNGPAYSAVWATKEFQLSNISLRSLQTEKNSYIGQETKTTRALEMGLHNWQFRKEILWRFSERNSYSSLLTEKISTILYLNFIFALFPPTFTLTISWRFYCLLYKASDGMMAD